MQLNIIITSRETPDGRVSMRAKYTLGPTCEDDLHYHSPRISPNDTKRLAACDAYRLCELAGRINQIVDDYSASGDACFSLAKISSTGSEDSHSEGLQQT